MGSAIAAEAALIHWGTEAKSSVADCPGHCTNFNRGPFMGGEGNASSGVSSFSETRGSAMASAALVGGLNAPVLKAQSNANPDSKGAFASAFGVQGYTYNGPGEILTLDVFLDGDVIDPEMDSSDTRITLEIVLYEADPFEFLSDRATLDFEYDAIPLTQTDNITEASVELQLDHSTGTNAIGQILVDVVTGDEFYIWALLQVVSQSGSNGTSADAFNTGTMDFLGSPDLISASSTVPLPAGVWLFGTGLLGLIGVARRKKA
jgi:hypothetical protein